MAVIASLDSTMIVTSAYVPGTYGFNINLKLNDTLTPRFDYGQFTYVDNESIENNKIKGTCNFRRSNTDVIATVSLEANLSVIVNEVTLVTRHIENTGSVKYAKPGQLVCGTQYTVTTTYGLGSSVTTNSVYLRKDTGYTVLPNVSKQGSLASIGTKKIISSSTTSTLTSGYLIGNVVSKTSANISDTSVAYYLNTSKVSYYRSRTEISSTALGTGDVGTWGYVASGRMYEFDDYTPMYITKTSPGTNVRTSSGTSVRYVTSTSAPLYEKGPVIGYNATTSLSGQTVYSVNSTGYYPTTTPLYEASDEILHPINNDPAVGTKLYSHAGTVYAVQGSYSGQKFYKAGESIKTVNTDLVRVYVPNDYESTTLTDTYTAGATEYYLRGASGLSTTETKTIYEKAD